MTQDQVIDKLVQKHFRINFSSYDEFEDGHTFYLSRKNPKIRAMTQLVEVDPDGFCNGISLNEYLKAIK